MKKQILVFLFLLVNTTRLVANPLDKLMLVNAEWKGKPINSAWIQELDMENRTVYNELIEAHLILVVKHLRSTKHKGFTLKQVSNRNRLLNILETYAHNKSFPTNDYLSYKNPVFIDRKGVHCAVGYLMQQSGHDKLAQEINAKQQFAYVCEITHPQLMSWASHHGFTLDELAWIQPAYPSSLGMNKVSEGVDGEVLCMINIDPNTSIIGGSFSKELKNNQTCNNIALLTFNGSGYDISPMQNGVNGKVMSLFLDGAYVFIGGEFTNANGVSVKNITRYNLLSGSQPYSNVGILNNPVLAITKHNTTILAASKSASDLIMKWDGNSTWTDAGTGLYGNEVRCFKYFNNELYIGGDFELPTGALRKHIAIYNPSGLLMASHMGNPTPVNCFEVLNNKLYAGCKFINGSDSCAIARLDSIEWTTIFKPVTNGNIKAMLQVGNGIQLFGSFGIFDGWSWSSNNGVLRFTTTGTPIIIPGVNLNSHVNTSLSMNGNVIFGGDFTENEVSAGPTSYANRIAYIPNYPSSLKDKPTHRNISIYPNPVTNELLIKADDIVFPLTVKIMNLQGAIIKEAILNSEKLSVSNLATGEYILKLNDAQNRSSSMKFLKE